MLFVDGRVTHISHLKEKAGFQVNVRADKEYSLPLKKLQHKTPTWQCECDQGNKAAPCQHVVAALAAMAYIFHEYNFINLSPIQANVNLLIKSIHLKTRPQETDSTSP
jgi:hypothetical protein